MFNIDFGVYSKLFIQSKNIDIVIYRECNNISLFDWCINLGLPYLSCVIYSGSHLYLWQIEALQCHSYSILQINLSYITIRELQLFSTWRLSNSNRVIELLTSPYRYKKLKISYSSFVLVSHRIAAPWLSLFATYRFYE